MTDPRPDRYLPRPHLSATYALFAHTHTHTGPKSAEALSKAGVENCYQLMGQFLLVRLCGRIP